MNEYEKILKGNIILNSELTKGDIERLYSLCTEIRKEAQKELLKELISKWYEDDKHKSLFGNYMTKRLRDLDK